MTDDDLDREILARLAHHDPPPPDLDERVLFVLALSTLSTTPLSNPLSNPLSTLDAEVARLAPADPVGARATERTRTTTFESPTRTVMITVVDRPDHLIRIDGWLAPATAARVELRFPEPTEPRTVIADEAGRFVFDEVPRGLAQLVIHPPSPDVPRVVTPSLHL
ncbi:hypothetical protein [Paractinoplanes rishiriensis]|uniref:Carboxypeptidase regulatory-like domain-containing protein n=1 Tax=Paractinoplanes rishiriensis TaxID=1050105 RepID=A0A919K965_9ACTN|nr:hypothetical protein [Actinoplanes rishiriensis]GIE98891.1 hypothetical protein Ari01nite_63560 [Actinoplanes rishiriensis]